MNVAAFDFDGTLTQRDTLLDYLRAVVGPRRVNAALLSSAPWFARAALHRPARDRAKERLIRSCLRGVTVERAESVAATYALTIAERPEIVADLRAHQAKGDLVVVASASPSIYVRPAVAHWGVTEVLATELEVVDGVLTGRFAGGNCRAEEKGRRFDDWLARHDVGEVHAYGNSPDDGPMLERADHPVWV